MTWIESVPNVSEGRRQDVLDSCGTAIRQSGACLLDVSADGAHHRSVFTVAGTTETVRAAVIALFDRAVATIDLRQHFGEHPRIGAVDVVPFVPLGDTTMAECVALARAVGREVADRYGVPVYLYENAASTPGRRNLADIRRGGFEGLGAKLRDPQWAPDFGPAWPHPSAGATAIGARPPLIAYNINLQTSRLDTARDIASAIRESSGGLPRLKAIGVALADRGLVQVSMNVTDFRTTSIDQAFDAVAREADRRGVAIVESEIIGLAPAAALSPSTAAHIRLRNDRRDCILEDRLKSYGIDL